MPPTGKLEEKLDTLDALIREKGKACVAFSGGVDSTFLLARAVKVIPGRVLAITARSPVHPAGESDRAKNMARVLGAEHLEIFSDDLAVPGFRTNPPDRCYHCKLERMRAIRSIAGERGFEVIFDGTNADDGTDYRPGKRALLETGIISPLAMAGLIKKEIRQASREMGLGTWDMPAYACLATRFPYGTEITLEGLQMVEKAEAALTALGFTGARVRAHGNVARIELDPSAIATAAGPASASLAKAVKEAGFAYAALDLEGYRQGSMNETLKGTGE